MLQRTRLMLAALAVLALTAGACSQGNDPSSWTEAHEDGNLRDNFMKACREANADGGIEFTASQTADYCRCAFREVVVYYGGEIDAEERISDAAEPRVGRDFSAFRDLEKSLRDNPDQIPADVEILFGACRDQALSP